MQLAGRPKWSSLGYSLPDPLHVQVVWWWGAIDRLDTLVHLASKGEATHAVGCRGHR